MSIKKTQVEDKSIRPNRSDGQEESNKKRPKGADGQVENKDDRPKNSDGQVEYNYPGQVTIKAKSKEEADEKFKKLNKE